MVARRVRRGVFGRDPGAYDRGRLPYPDRVYEVLVDRCGLRPGAAVFEIGPGTGIATRELLRHGADPLLLIERDRRLARYLGRTLQVPEPRLTIATTPFESARLGRGAFDLGVAASSFHWLPPRRALLKIARALRPGGWWAAWGNAHGDPTRPSDFRRAIQPLYRDLAGGRRVRPPSRSAEHREQRERLRALRSVGRFDRISCELIRWTAGLETARVTALWATFSDIVTLSPPRRSRFLEGLARIVDEEFGGRVALPVLTPLYTARRNRDR